MTWDRSLWPALSPLLDRALDLDAAGREALLRSVAAESAPMAAALEDLLAQHQRALSAQFLDHPFASDSTVPSSLAGHAIGAYTLERPLGMGGMGTVWLARRSDGRFEGAVAIKLLHLALFDQEGQRRFRREGTILARLSHAHIARLLDAGVTPSGQPFLVLEHVEGARLDTYADEQRLDIEARLRLFLQVADAVAHAHSHFVIHRDLKPSNILVTADGDAKLLDFGIATLVSESADAAGGTRTQTGRALTPEYAAPEQAIGLGVTAATDVYALGVLLYHLLVGRHPTSPHGAPDVEVLSALATREPLPPSEVARRLAAGDPDSAAVLEQRRSTRDRLRRACRGDLDVIVLQALKKQPAERYSSVEALAADIRRHLAHEPVLARRDSLPYRLSRAIARHRIEVVAAALVILSLAVGTMVAIRQARAAAVARDRALASLRRSEAANDLTAFLLSQAHPDGKPISNAELLARGESLVKTRYAGEPELRVHLLLMLADRFQENQQFADMHRVVKQAFDESRAFRPGGLRAYAGCYAGFSAAEQSDVKAATALVDAGLAEFVGTPDDTEYEGQCRQIESIVWRRVGDFDRAIRAAQRAVAFEEQRGGTPGGLFEPLSALAVAFGAADRHAEASAVRHRMLDILDREGQGNTLRAAVLMNNWSAQVQNAGQMLEGARLGARAVDIARAVDSENGASLTMLNTYASALIALGQDDVAVPLLDESIAKARKAGSSARLARSLITAIMSSADSRDLERANRLAGEARSLRGLDDYSTGLLQIAEARLAGAAGHPDDAVRLAQQGVATLSGATASGASLTSTRIVLAELLNEDGRFAEALVPAEQALAVARQRVHDTPSWHVGRALLAVAMAKRGLHDVNAARALAADARTQLVATAGEAAPITQRADALVADLARR